MNYIRTGFSRLSSALTEGAHIVVPAAVGLAGQAILHDSRIGKVVSGAGLTISGFGLLASSGVPRTLKSWCWTNTRSQTEDSAPKTALQWGAAAAGLATTCYGIYSMAMGILELTVPGYGGAFLSNDSNLDTRPGTCDVRLAQAKRDLLFCPEARKLWDEVESKGPFTVRCATTDEVPFGANVDPHERTISVSERGDEIEIGQYLLMELNNLKRVEEFPALWSLKSCILGADQYALSVEAVEYEAVKDTHKIANSCVNGGFWPASLDYYKESLDGDWASFEGSLKTQERNGHTDRIRLWWYKGWGTAWGIVGIGVLRLVGVWIHDRYSSR